MKITLLTVGKIKEKYFTDAINEYKKRLSRYCRLDIKEAADEKTGEDMSEAEADLIRKKEGDRIRHMIPEDSYIISLCIDGPQMDSVEFSRHLEKLMLSGHSHISFMIGGSIGLDRDLVSESSEKLSFSKMTFPHQLMRVILLEQIYRAFRIMKNEPYHK